MAEFQQALDVHHGLLSTRFQIRSWKDAILNTQGNGRNDRPLCSGHFRWARDNAQS